VITRASVWQAAPKLLVIVFILVLPVALGSAALIVWANAAIYVLFALGLCATFCYTGKLSLGQSLFGPLAGYTVGILAMHTGLQLGVSVVLAVIVSMVGAVLVLPTLRLTGFYFAIGTLLLGLIMTDLVEDQLATWTNGNTGLVVLNKNVMFWNLFDLHARYYVFWVLVILVASFYGNLERTRTVRLARAVKANPLISQSLGVNPVVVDAKFFVLSGAVTGLAAALLVGSLGTVTPGMFSFDSTVSVFAGVVIGGRRGLWGAVVGGTFVTLLSQELAVTPALSPIIYGGTLVVVIGLLPSGLSSLPDRLWRLARHRLRLGSSAGAGDYRATSRPKADLTITEPTLSAADSGPARGITLLDKVRDRLTSEPIPSGEGTHLAKLLGGERGPDAPAERRSVALGLDGVSVRIGELALLSDLTFDLETHTALGVLGPNGAGKSSLLNAITGYAPLSSGRITLDGVDVTGMKPQELRRRGLVRAFQIPQVFSELRTWENIALGLDNDQSYGLIRSGLRGPGVRRAERRIHEDARALAEFVGLSHVVNRFGNQLSVGQRRLVELARCLASDAKVFLLDEPFAGVAEDMIDHVTETLLALKGRGCALLLIDHNISDVLAVADDGIFLSGGSITARGTMREVVSDPVVKSEYVGL